MSDTFREDSLDDLTTQEALLKLTPGPTLKRRWTIALVFVVLIVAATVPPLISIGRYQRRVAISMSQVLGRPVHLDHVSLNLLPFPSLTLTHLVIDDLPPFGLEPMVQANRVDARLRLLPLWRHQVEFSRITFEESSFNLVRLADGHWNLESLLLQAAHLDTAPTAPHSAGRQPRFPYIAATGARLNVKFDQVKSPYSLTEADVALWLPQPREWSFRLRGRPSRTDTSASDTGVIQVESTLKAAGNIGAVPITSTITWLDAPLGEASRIVFGRDADFRGTLQMSATLDGTLDDARLQSHIGVSDVHRVDIRSSDPVDLDLNCKAHLSNLLRQVQAFSCNAPVSNLAQGVIISGSVPDTWDPRHGSFSARAQGLPLQTLLQWGRAVSAKMPRGLTAAGSAQAQVNYDGAAQSLTADAHVDDALLTPSDPSSPPVLLKPIDLQGTLALTPGSARTYELAGELAPTTISFTSQAKPTNDDLALFMSADNAGLSGVLRGRANSQELRALAVVLPVLGGLVMDAPVGADAGFRQIDQELSKHWGAPVVWNEGARSIRTGVQNRTSP